MLLFNTVVALFVTIMSEDTFSFNLIVAQSIGLSIYLTVILIHQLFGLNFLTLWPSAVAIPVGIVLGVIIATSIQNIDLMETVHFHSKLLTLSAIVPLIFGVTISYYLHSQAYIAETQQALEAETMCRTIQARDLAESRMKLLQGQIEPHFLFNVHSNILSLMEREPEKAKKMLSMLTQYLRSSLRHMRKPQVTLREEMALLEFYLSIQSIRMDKRLSYQIQLPNSLADILIPPLLIQPLVENSITHGLEPSIDGGMIHISAQEENNYLLLEVCDTGLGFKKTFTRNEGVGLENVHDRISSVYHGKGRLEVRENIPRGVLVSIYLPLQNHEMLAS